MVHTEFEHNARSQYGTDTLVIGMDEAGCGPWAGPLVVGVCAVHRETTSTFMNDLEKHGLSLRDSKTLSPHQRTRLYDYIQAQSRTILTGIGVCDAAMIDDRGLVQALRDAARQAFDALMQKATEHAWEWAQPVVLMDGIRDPHVPARTHLIKRGDAQSASIAAAAIMAKVTRDRIMDQLHEVYPHYGWNTNKGYGTKAHQDALHTHGVSPYHRISFKPIQRLCA